MSRSQEEPLSAFDVPRPINRAALRGDRDREVERAATLLRRRQGDNR